MTDQSDIETDADRNGKDAEVPDLKRRILIVAACFGGALVFIIVMKSTHIADRVSPVFAGQIAVFALLWFLFRARAKSSDRFKSQDEDDG